ncbi:hypothetical protein C5B42_00135 [Candidatus Cerribacteria bacterium 'Amazon FNV 2010 28 9']|uniref:Uncharacterized protein n=1 Tax=Candidatus Cerribacteria bacterium 'Amazon FNV 2010 28 9' TaxID=2081795 RepID=A0A317JQL6_9BACT|nr:MAG: hypothetical protein C5B42_00135 [Candidatus Cerribacteria bacterium 'Amazon FNV 2010 28 9']
MRKRIVLLLLVLTLSLGTFLRFFKVSTVPPGLEQDETSIGYNAYSILKTGKDEYGQSFPLYFKAFGEYKLPGYIYAAVIPIKFFGLTPFAVRSVSALTGTLSILLIFWIVQFLFHRHEARDEIALWSAFLLAINPWHLFFSRGAFEVTLALFLLLVGLFAFLKAIYEHRPYYVLITSITFLLSLYTYNISRVFVPLLCCALLCIYRKRVLRIPRTILGWCTGIFILGLLPFAFSLLSPGGVHAIQGTILFSSKAVQAPLIEMRSDVSLFSPLLAKLFFNSWLQSLWQYCINIMSYASVEFFFLSGSTQGDHGIGNMGQFYFVQLPLLFVGLFALIKRQTKTAVFLFFWCIATILIAALTREAPQATRSFNLIFSYTVLSAYGIWELRTWIVKQKQWIKIGIGLLVVSFFAYNCLYYFASYYIRFPLEYTKQWNALDPTVVQYMENVLKDYDVVYVDNRVNIPYTSLLFYSQYSPTFFQATQQRGTQDAQGFSPVKAYGNVIFDSIDWDKEIAKHNQRILYITTPQFLPAKPDHINIVERFYYPPRPVILSQGEELYTSYDKELGFVAVRTY